MGDLRLRLIPMTESHVPVLAKLERLCFSVPWSEQSLRSELGNELAYFCVAEFQEEETTQIAGYAGMHCVVGECYVDNVAVFPSFRRQGVGRALMKQLLAVARERGNAMLTLEVRASNLPAIALYQGLGLKEVGRRRDFYVEPKEDARILTKYFEKEPGTET